jgi:pimeloyl-ACP methyl ester carboxylesterase
MDPGWDTAVVHRMVDLRRVRLHYVEAGAGPLVVLLHGFPQHWIAWGYQIPALVEAGYRIVAPDLRGYNLSDRPRRVREYRSASLVSDVVELLDALGSDRVRMVGHDWGGMVAWWLAMDHPERVERLVVLNAPHPLRYVRALATRRQLGKSWYIFFSSCRGCPNGCCGPATSGAFVESFGMTRNGRVPSAIGTSSGTSTPWRSQARCEARSTTTGRRSAPTRSRPLEATGASTSRPW